MTALPHRPLLVSKARLRRDRRAGGYLLLYPERGLALNEAAAAVVALCDGSRTLDEILTALFQTYPADPPAIIEAQTRSFLAELSARGLLDGEARA